jgi:hypothetical protein
MLAIDRLELVIAGDLRAALEQLDGLRLDRVRVGQVLDDVVARIV